MRNPTPPHLRLDAEGRPYFLWDCPWTDAEFRAFLRDPDPDVRAMALGRLMRQAKPDDVFEYASEAEIRACWERLLPYLGSTREFWTWLFAAWAALDA